MQYVPALTGRASIRVGRPFFHPLSRLPAYAENLSAKGAAARNPVAHDISPRTINSSSSMRLTEAEVDRVATAIHDSFGG